MRPTTRRAASSSFACRVSSVECCHNRHGGLVSARAVLVHLLISHTLNLTPELYCCHRNSYYRSSNRQSTSEAIDRGAPRTKQCQPSPSSSTCLSRPLPTTSALPSWPSSPSRRPSRSRFAGDRDGARSGCSSHSRVRSCSGVSTTTRIGVGV